MKQTEQKNVFVVLGMARSGTSAITRGLQALGVDLGEQLTPGGKWNPTGFWEDHDIVYKINGKIFSTLQFAPYGIQRLEPELQLSEALDAVRSSALTLLNERFATTNHWGFKDPSTVKTLTFWQALFTTANIQDHYIIALRNPLAAAQSYQKLTGTPLEVGLLLWLMHLLPAIDDTHGRKRIVVSYELLLQQPQAELTRMQKNLALTSLCNQDNIDAYVNEFLDKDLHHYAFDNRDLKLHPAAAVTPLCAQAYEFLLRLARDEIQFDSEEFFSLWQEIKTELEKIYPIYCYIDMLLKQNKQLEKNLHTIHKSILWKMLYPLRIIDDALRAKRVRSRAQKRLAKAYG